MFISIVSNRYMMNIRMKLQIYIYIFQNTVACNSPNVKCVAKYDDVEVCVPEVLQCDGTFQCKQGEDEENCPGPTQCNVGEISCNDGNGCVLHAKECDGKEDCSDGSDEMINCGKYNCS